jgi:DUF4097 and DUF4098 domain-containing protein YvlB
MLRRSFIVLALAASVAAPAGAQSIDHEVARAVKSATKAARAAAAYQGQNRSEETERSKRDLKLGANGQIELENIAGTITVIAGNNASLEIVKVARGRTPEDAKEQLPLVNVQVVERAGRVEVRTQYPGSREWRRDNSRRNISVSVNYNVTVPAGTRVNAKSISGDIHVKDIKGDLSLETISGAVRIANAGRIASASSTSGNVELTDTAIEGGLELGSISGSVILRRVKARRIDASTVSGNVIVQEVDCERIEAESISGNIDFSGNLSRGGHYAFSSHSGQVKVAVDGRTGFEVEAESFSGNVRTDLQLQNASTQGGRRQRELRGVFGDGSAVLDLTTFSGSILITKR